MHGNKGRDNYASLKAMRSLEENYEGVNISDTMSGFLDNMILENLTRKKKDRNFKKYNIYFIGEKNIEFVIKIEIKKKLLSNLIL